jgi:anti-anti-sigma regulatory factor
VGEAAKEFHAGPEEAADLIMAEDEAVANVILHGYHAVDRDRDSRLQQHMKLLNPHPKVTRTLELTGFTRLFEIYTDLDQALASFH